MKKLDKEALADKYSELYVNLASKETRFAGYLAGLEYAENHYLAKLQEQETLLNQYREDYIRLCKYKVEAKELLEESLTHLGKIKLGWGFFEEKVESFLKQ